LKGVVHTVRLNFSLTVILNQSRKCCTLRNAQCNCFMVKSFKHKGLRKLFETGSVVGIQPGHKQKLRMRLTALDTATYIEDMDIPGWRLHSLKGNREGLWAIDVSRNWRIVFEFSDGNAYAVDYEDYH
jgi:proteic killer suppression protein